MISSDVYVFLNSIDIGKINSFFRTYLSDFMPSDDFFEYPKYGTPIMYETDIYEEMLAYVVGNKKDYTFYFDTENSKSPYKQSVLRINKDNSMLLRVSVDSSIEQKIIEFLKKEFNTDDVFVTFNIPPITSKEDILKALSRPDTARMSNEE